VIIRLIEIHTHESLVPHPSHFEVQIINAKLKIYKSPGSDQIPVELFQIGDETLWSETHKITKYLWCKEETPEQWKASIIVQI
jgi:hypothetical protein